LLKECFLMSLHCKHSHTPVGHQLLVESHNTLQSFKRWLIHFLAVDVDEQLSVVRVILVVNFLLKYLLEYFWLLDVFSEYWYVIVKLPSTLLLKVVFIAIRINPQYLWFVWEPKPLGVHWLSCHRGFIIEKLIFHLELEGVLLVDHEGDLLLRGRSRFPVYFVVRFTYLVEELFQIFGDETLEWLHTILFLLFILVKLFNIELV